jgi:hypothetical protein
MTQPMKPLFRRISRKLDLDDSAWRWLRTGEPKSTKWLGMYDSKGRQIGTVEEVWAIYGDEIIAALAQEEQRPYALDYFNVP